MLTIDELLCYSRFILLYRLYIPQLIRQTKGLGIALIRVILWPFIFLPECPHHF
ncbi:hypothetical protein KL86SPO_31603 [uncultured Sporomusa sp.]|uniref:Uncharacterized protein n=1 Tax=uncultured Sporomusa sp. TaxID=307249 RepID=A0A212LUW6_9FIRM|nr:hypothetical protein KL86SPO_31603 [uncultured Sporomusa sp.]